MSTIPTTFFKTKWQIKFNTVQYTSNQTDIPSMRFSNLEVGKTYRLTMSASIINGDASGELRAMHDSSVIAVFSNKSPSLNNNDRGIGGSSRIFTATATSLTFDYVEFDTAAQLDNTNTWAIIEELSNHELTSEWL